MTLVAVDREAIGRRLAGAVTPEEVVAAFAASIDGATLRGLYLADQHGVLHLETRFDHDPELAATLDPDDGIENASLLRFDFRDRPFGAVALGAPIEGLEPVLASDVAPALFRSLYLDDALSGNQRMREQLFYLDEMGKLLGHLDLDLLLVNVLELTASHLGADVGSITLQRPEGLVTAVDWGLPHEAVIGLQLTDGTPFVDAVPARAEPMLLSDSDLRDASGQPLHFDRLLVLPLNTNDAHWGSINLVAPTRVETLDVAALDSIRSGVGLAATAVENALLLEIKLSREREQEQLKVGHQIQSALLPEDAPDIDGFDLAGSSVSATMIGGDYYDYFDLPDGRHGLIVADVSGKGVPAGLIMTATRALFRATTARLSEPGRILGEVNRLLCAEGFGARFVTGAFLALDPATGRCTFSTAGHDPPMIYRHAAAKVESRPLPALPLGLRPGDDYDEHTVHLAAGDAVLVYTDGVSEAMNAEREQFGEDRLREVLARGADDTAIGLRDRILDAVGRHCGPITRHDDTTMIVVRRTSIDPSSERAER